MRVVTGNFINGNLKLNEIEFFSPNFLKKKIKNLKSTVTKNGKWPSLQFSNTQLRFQKTL